VTVRILHVSQPVDAGVAVVLADLVEHQSALGWEVHVACPPVGWLVDRLAGSDVRVHAWEASRSPGAASLSEARSLRRLARRIAPDVVHLHSAKAGLAGRLALRGSVPTVFQPHAWSFHAAGRPLHRATVLWERLAMRWTDLLIAVSDDELDDGVQLGIRAPHSQVVSNGVDVRQFTPGDREQAREHLGLGHGHAPLALCIGRLARQKGQDLALEAWPRVRELVPGARLAIVGDGPERAALKSALPAGVSMHPGVPEPRSWFAAADVVVLPSRWEGMALVPLEAMASARSVVGFQVSGVAESIGDAGETVPIEDVEALADAIARRLADPALAEREGLRGRERAVERFDRSRALADTTRATEELLGLDTSAVTTGELNREDLERR
jgi:glycosyltransferase involved in cell wall biosynthesis